jgi:two-component system, OmpR family, sensor histidine kinase CpxA
MKLYIRSLFWKIFLWFWATVIVIALSLVVTFILDPGKSSSRWHESLTRTAHYSGTAAIEVAELHGAPAASAYMRDLENTTHLHACLLDEGGDVIAGGSCDLFARNISLARSTHNINVFLKDGIARVALPILSTHGRNYIYAAEIPVGTPSGISKTAIAIRLCLAFFVSFCICYLLTRYLTAPILRLREASHRLAAGDLSTRASGSMERRNDELGFLVRDFNAMAGRMEELISRQKQLIYDVSHELRSPLARLNVALDLGRKRKGNDSAFDHMEHDLDLMSEMIGRMLTVAKLDSSTEVHMTRVDLGELASRVVRSAEFELGQRANAVRFTMREECFVHGNAELLQSAIENVVRNAVRYTTSDASVDVQLQHVEKAAGRFILLSVRDYGTGVPEEELSNIFRPFYRVANDRDRQSGGAGLGLAIADRVIRVHGGTIHAENASLQGLRVDIFLPAAK